LIAALVGGVGAAVLFRPAAQRPTLVADSPSWRAEWALSLDYANQLDGSRLTCRLVAHVSLSGSQVRFRLVNYPATSAVTFSHLVAAVRTKGLSVDPSTQRTVTVGGLAAVTLPPNGAVMTDPVGLPVKRGQDLTLSVAVSAGVSAPLHFWSSETSGCTAPDRGDLAMSVSGKPFDQFSQDRWLSEVQVAATDPVPTIAVYGDSLTAGVFLAQDSGARWTDQLEAQSDGRLVILNYGVIGDRITGLAPPGELPSRFTRDVLSAPNLSAVLIQMGSNDIKAGVSAAAILAQFRRAAAEVARLHATLIVATVPPRGDNLTAADEHQRQLLNAALRRYPIVADMDAALTDPNTHRLQARYDVGDHIHPDQAGVAVITSVMRNAISQVPGPVGAAVG
jgi:lysophospholipase L1-like esterase